MVRSTLCAGVFDVGLAEAVKDGAAPAKADEALAKAKLAAKAAGRILVDMLPPEYLAEENRFLRHFTMPRRTTIF